MTSASMLYRVATAVCFAVIALSPADSSAADDRLAGYRPVDISAWQPRTSASAMAVVEPLYRTHPESVEGLPTLKIVLRQDDAGGLLVDIEMTGYLDDSVAGEQFRALIGWTAEGWRLDALGVRYICARGDNAGTPTVDLCP